MEGRVILTVDREHGALGAEIARETAKKLGIPAYGRAELNELLAETSPDDGKKHVFGKRILAEDRLFRRQAELLKELAGRSSCVVIGRCGDYLLRDFEETVKIFIRAPFHDRVWHLMAGEEISEPEAEEEIRRIDRERADYYHYYTEREWGDPEHYDLIFNSSPLGVKGSVKLILNYLEGRKSL